MKKVQRLQSEKSAFKEKKGQPQKKSRKGKLFENRGNTLLCSGAQDCRKEVRQAKEWAGTLLVCYRVRKERKFSGRKQL